jgi:DNA-directed RNA polymerase specialized sigma24 family protein
MVKAGVESAEAVEVARELWADLLAKGEGKRPLLATYQGRCALGTWLNRVALSRALVRIRREERHRRTVDQAEAEGVLVPSAPSVAPDPSEQFMRADALLREMLRDAIRRAFGSLDAEDFVLLFLMHDGDLRIQELSRIFACDPKTVNSRAKAASGQVRFSVQAEIAGRDPWLKLRFEDVLSLLQPDLPHLFESLDAVPNA